MNYRRFLGDDRHPKASWWPERLAAALALAGVVIALLPGFNVRTWQDAASDYKTVYASGTLFLRGAATYNFPNLESVFRQYGVIIPRSWYAHAPTYPPFTFAMLAPVLAFPMVTSVYVWMFVCTLALVIAVWAMADHSEMLGVSRFWRLLLIVVVGVLPTVSFSLLLGNLVIVSAALGVIAVMYSGKVSPNWLAFWLTVSLLLKPHIALLVLIGMVLSRNKVDRALALRTFAFFAGALTLFALIFFHRQLGLQLGGYVAMVREEIAVGCLNPHNHELMTPPCEIISLESLLGFFLPDRWSIPWSIAGLVLMAGVLVYVTRQQANNRADTRLELLGAWGTLGMLSTYHRADDAMLLLMLMPWVLVRWKRKLYDPVAWLVLLSFLYMGFNTDLPTFDWLVHLGLPKVADFMVFRQAPLMTILLMASLLAHLLYHGRSPTVPHEEGSLLDDRAPAMAG